MVILVRVVILSMILREPRADAESSGPYSVKTQRTGGPSRKRSVRVVEIRLAKLHVSREYRIPPEQAINSEDRSKEQSKQQLESRPIRKLFPIGNSASRSNPQGLVPTGRMTYFSSSYPCPSSSCPACAKVAGKGCRVDHYLSNDPGGRGACLAATCGWGKDASG